MGLGVGSTMALLLQKAARAQPKRGPSCGTGPGTHVVHWQVVNGLVPALFPLLPNPGPQFSCHTCAHALPLRSNQMSSPTCHTS